MTNHGFTGKPDQSPGEDPDRRETAKVPIRIEVTDAC
jgi:hypothetical protein